MKEYLAYQGLFQNMPRKDLEWLLIKLRDYQIKRRSTLNVDKRFSFGVEIEFCDILLLYVEKRFKESENLKKWLNVYDKSCSYKADNYIIGGEVDTDILHDTKKDWDTLKEALTILKELKAHITDKNGLHVHVGSQIFGTDIKNVIRFIKVWCIFEHVIFRFSYGKSKYERSSILSFAHPIAQETALKYQFMPYMLDYLEEPMFLHLNKNCALNFLNYSHLTEKEERNNTIEIRCANGTLSLATIQNTVNFYLKLMQYVTSPTYDEERINSIFKKLKPKDFTSYHIPYIKDALLLCDLIFDNNLDKINFLKQYIKKDDPIFVR